MEIFSPTFWQSFLSDSLATIIGVGLGFPAALLINKFIESRTEKERRKKILNVLFDELKEDYGYLELWRGSRLKIPKIPKLYVSLYSESWEAFSNGGELEWINDITLLNILATSYNKISAVQYLANKFFDMAYSGSKIVDQATLEEMESSLNLSIESAYTVIGRALEYIEAVQQKNK